jgi:hypothetical protein
MPSGSTGFDVFSSGLFVVARTGVRVSLGSGYCAIGATDFPWLTPGESVCRGPGVRSSLETGHSLSEAPRDKPFPWPAGPLAETADPGKALPLGPSLGPFDPGMALRHEGFRLAQLGAVEHRGRLDRAGRVPQSGLRRVIFPANEQTKIRFAGGSPVRGGPWGCTIHSSLWT